MAEKITLQKKCYMLSEEVLQFGAGINGRRAAQTVYAQLIEASTELGSGVRALDFLPARSMRIRLCEDLVRYANKVIYLLKLSGGMSLFPRKSLEVAIDMAVKISNDVTALTQSYAGVKAPAPAEEQKPAEAPAAVQQPAQPADPDGFNAAYDGIL